MREIGLSARQGRPRTPRATDSGHDLPIAPNRLGAKLRRRTGGDQVWLADISYKPTGEGWLYLAAIKDMATRQIVGWSMTDSKPIFALPPWSRPCSAASRGENPSQRSWCAERNQVVVATRGLLSDRSNRSSTSAGVFHASVFRGWAFRGPPRRQWRRHCVR
jgi:hypothetical protein